MKKLLLMTVLGITTSIIAQEAREMTVEAPEDQPLTYENLEKDVNKRLQEKKLVTEPQVPMVELSGATAAVPASTLEEGRRPSDEEEEFIKEETLMNGSTPSMS